VSIWLLGFVGWLACSDEQIGVEDVEAEDTAEPLLVTIDPDVAPPEWLSETHLLQWDGNSVTHNEAMFVYELNTSLFTDYAIKQRAIWMPEGTQANYVGDGDVLEFPVGTVITKTFMMASDMRQPQQDLTIIETRLLILGSNGWNAWPYLWLEDGSDAQRWVPGQVQVFDFIDPQGTPRTANYLVPQRNQCLECHEVKDVADNRVLMPIGPTPRNINRLGVGDSVTNQLEALIMTDRLSGLASVEEVDAAHDFGAIERDGVEGLDESTIESAARDYLDINCAHCHSPNGIEGETSQLFLNYDNDDAFHLGVCKPPGSAGQGAQDRDYDIVPGDPQASILHYRTQTEELGAMMPQIGRSLAHTQGAALIWAWIEQMPPDDCLDE